MFTTEPGEQHMSEVGDLTDEERTCQTSLQNGDKTEYWVSKSA